MSSRSKSARAVRAASLRPVTVVVVLLAAALSSCGSTTSRTSDQDRFADQSKASKITCLVHQTRRPDRAYTSPDKANTFAVLRVLRYYVANGGKTYCDHRPPSRTDRAWIDLYVRLGADPSYVSNLRSGAGTR